MIILSVLEPTFEKAKTLIANLDKFANNIQIDVVDGKLYDGKTFLDLDKIETLETAAKLEIHLMVENPMQYLEKKYKNVTKICTQIEAIDDANVFISKALSLGYIVGLSIGPDTNYDQIEQYLPKLNFVQFMDIYPGKQGQKQIPETLIKIKQFTQKFPNVKVQVDGSINSLTVEGLINAGVDDLIVGSAIIKDSNPQEMYVQLNDMANTKKASVTSLSDIKNKKIRRIAVLGGAAWKESDQVYKDTFEVCKVLAEAGYEIINGGGPGVMRASTKGAHAGGGRVLAITYHPNKPKRHYEGVDLENDFDDEIITLDYFDRTKVMLQTTELHIVFKGSLGTLSELGMTWISSWIHEPDNKPIILYGDFWNHYLDWIDEDSLVGEAEKNILNVCTTPEQVLEVVRRFDS